jgi:ketosteroid isomerase-like protein
MPDDGKQVVEQFLALGMRGDVDGVLALVGSTCVVQESGGVPHSGTYVGPNGFRDLLTKMLPDFAPVVTDATVHDAGEFVVARMNATFTSQDNGRSITMPVTEMYWVKDGKISHIDVYYKNPRLFDELTAAARV